MAGYFLNRPHCISYVHTLSFVNRDDKLEHTNQVHPWRPFVHHRRPSIARASHNSQTLQYLLRESLVNLNQNNTISVNKKCHLLQIIKKNEIIIHFSF